MKTQAPTQARSMPGHTEHPHITRDPSLHSGRPVIRGTGVPVWLIAGFYKAGDTVEEITHHYPHLKAASVYDAISYYLDHMDEVERELSENRAEYVLAKHELTPDGHGIVRLDVRQPPLRKSSRRKAAARSR